MVMTMATGETRESQRMQPVGRPEAEAGPPPIAEFAPFFKAFCNGTRAAIVEQLLGGERCVCEIVAELDVSQPLISHHLAILREAGFVCQRGEGTRTYYSIDWEAFDERLDAFLQLVEGRRRLDPGHPSAACPATDDPVTSARV
jgi:ArsR family transcriptional regulator, arsenate/arsenite/antimonite-responsive transcriptional repressor